MCPFHSARGILRCQSPVGFIEHQPHTKGEASPPNILGMSAPVPSTVALPPMLSAMLSHMDSKEPQIGHRLARCASFR